MTNKVGRPKKLENMNEDERFEHYQNVREMEKQDRQERIDNLTEGQQEAIKDLSKAINTIMISYQEMCHPSFGDIIELDNALWAFNRQLNQE